MKQAASAWPRSSQRCSSLRTRLPPAGRNRAREGPGLLLDRCLDAPELDEILWLDDSQHFDAAAGLRCASAREAQSDPRLRTVDDDDEISASRIVPHLQKDCCVKRLASASVEPEISTQA